MPKREKRWVAAAIWTRKNTMKYHQKKQKGIRILPDFEREAEQSKTVEERRGRM